MDEKEGKPRRCIQEGHLIFLGWGGDDDFPEGRPGLKDYRGSVRQTGEGFPSPIPALYKGLEVEERAQDIWRLTGSKEREVRSGVQVLPSSEEGLAYSLVFHPMLVSSYRAQSELSTCHNFLKEAE